MLELVNEYTSEGAESILKWGILLRNSIINRIVLKYTTRACYYRAFLLFIASISVSLIVLSAAPLQLALIIFKNN